jgi:8-oxo-dGTP diphosphatase
VAVYVGSALLLVRSSYRRGRHLPGGGVRRGEIPETAARRELAEEIGLRASELLPAGFTCDIWDGRRDRVHSLSYGWSSCHNCSSTTERSSQHG